MTEIMLLLALVLLTVFASLGWVWPTIVALGALTVCCILAAERPAGDRS